MSVRTGVFCILLVVMMTAGATASVTVGYTEQPHSQTSEELDNITQSQVETPTTGPGLGSGSEILAQTTETPANTTPQNNTTNTKKRKVQHQHLHLLQMELRQKPRPRLQRPLHLHLHLNRAFRLPVRSKTLVLPVALRLRQQLHCSSILKSRLEPSLNLMNRIQQTIFKSSQYNPLARTQQEQSQDVFNNHRVVKMTHHNHRYD